MSKSINTRLLVETIGSFIKDKQKSSFTWDELIQFVQKKLNHFQDKEIRTILQIFLKEQVIMLTNDKKVETYKVNAIFN